MSSTANKSPKNAEESMSETAQRALDMKREAQAKAPPQPPSRTADEGMQPIPNTGIAPSGALGAEGHRPVLERSRKVR